MPSQSADESLVRLVRGLRAQAEAARQRHALLLCGEPDWCRARAHQALAALAAERALWIGQSAAAGVAALPAAKARGVLGSEYDLVVFDAFDGLDPEALGAVSGALRGGGLFILLAPPLAQWADFADPERERLCVHPYTPAQLQGRFLRRLARCVQASPALCRWQQGEAPPVPDDAVPVAAAEPWPEGPFRSADQQAAVAAIERVLHGHRRRPLVLTSDRGRGKSAALGIAAARLAAAGPCTVLVTAPRLDAVAALFEQAAHVWPGAQGSRQQLHDGRSMLSFLAPDALCQTLPEADLVLVDEAAAIPTALLKQLLAHYPRIVFASTVHGYEGNGRGFALRFRQELDAKTPGWHELALHTPIRWAPDDPLEAFVFEALMLSAQPAEAARIEAATPATVEYRELERDRLEEDETLLGELFGLLVLAHYQTSPLDLRHLLDGPNLRVLVLRQGGAVVATALLAEEGGFDEALAQQIWEGRRRPRGHLLAQSLACHLGFAEAARRRYLRVMRIAVHPAVQGRGLGSELLARAEALAREEGIDFIGASFGATAELVDFWQRNGQAPVRLGFSRGASSGTHALMVLKPLKPESEALFAAMRTRFQETLALQLGAGLADVAPELVARCLRGAETQFPLSAQDRRDLAGFAHALRGYEPSETALWKLALAALARPATEIGLSAQDEELLIGKVLQKRPWQAVAAGAGKRQTIERLRAISRRLLKRLGVGD